MANNRLNKKKKKVSADEDRPGLVSNGPPYHVDGDEVGGVNHLDGRWPGERAGDAVDCRAKMDSLVA